MAKQTVGALNAKFQADTRDFTDGLQSIEVSTRDLKRIQRDATSAMDDYEDKVLKLRAALSQGKITQEQYNKAVTKYKDRLEDADGKQKDVTKSWNTMANVISAGAQVFDKLAQAIGVAIKAYGAFEDQSKKVVEQEQLAKRLGVTTQELQIMQEAFREVGIEGEQSGDMLTDMIERIGDAATEEKQNTKAFMNAMMESLGDPKTVGKANKELGDLAQKFRMLGLSGDELSKGSLREALIGIAEGLRGLDTQAEKVHFLDTLGGEQLAKALPVFERMNEALAESEEKVQKFGLAMSDEQVEAWKELNSAMIDARRSMEGFWNSLTAEDIAALRELVEALTELVMNLRDLNTETGVLQTGVRNATRGMRGAGNVVGGVERGDAGQVFQGLNQMNPIETMGRQGMGVMQLLGQIATNTAAQNLLLRQLPQVNVVNGL